MANYPKEILTRDRWAAAVAEGDTNLGLSEWLKDNHEGEASDKVVPPLREYRVVVDRITSRQAVMTTMATSPEEAEYEIRQMAGDIDFTECPETDADYEFEVSGGSLQMTHELLKYLRIQLLTSKALREHGLQLILDRLHLIDLQEHYAPDDLIDEIHNALIAEFGTTPVSKVVDPDRPFDVQKVLLHFAEDLDIPEQAIKVAYPK